MPPKSKRLRAGRAIKSVSLSEQQRFTLQDCALYWPGGKIPAQDFEDLLCNLLGVGSSEREREVVRADVLQSGAASVVQNDGDVGSAEVVLVQRFVDYHQQDQQDGQEGEGEVVGASSSERAEEDATTVAASASATPVPATEVVQSLQPPQQQRPQQHQGSAASMTVLTTWVADPYLERALPPRSGDGENQDAIDDQAGVPPLQKESLPEGARFTLNAEEFVLGEKLGKGGFGVVYSARRQQRANEAAEGRDRPSQGEGAEQSTQLVAVKFSGSDFKASTVFTVEAVAAAEVRKLAQQRRAWQGKVFLPLLHAFGEASFAGDSRSAQKTVLFAIVMEMADGTLEDKLFSGGNLLKVAWALASTLSLLNEAGFLHGDLKPSNVLWRRRRSSNQAGASTPELDGWPLLSDFGTAQCFNNVRPGEALQPETQVQTRAMTRAFAAPEVLEAARQGPILQTMKSDMFSWALTIDKVSLTELQIGIGIGSSDTSTGRLKRLLQRCQKPDPALRPSTFHVIAAEVLELEEAADGCLEWGQELWEQQQRALACEANRYCLARHVDTMAEAGIGLLASERRWFRGPQSEYSSKREVADALFLQSKAHYKLGRFASSVALLQQAVIMEPTCAAAPLTLRKLGVACSSLGDHKKQQELLERSLAIDEAYYGESHVEVAKPLRNLALACASLGDYEWACSLLERCIRICEEQASGEGDLMTASRRLQNRRLLQKWKLHRRAQRTSAAVQGLLARWGSSWTRCARLSDQRPEWREGTTGQVFLQGFEVGQWV